MPYLPDAAAHLRLQFRHAVGGEVGQVGGVEMAPQVFHRIQFRGVGRQPFDLQQWRWLATQLRVNRLTSAPERSHTTSMGAYR